MIEIRIPITAEQADILEGYFCEDYQECWMLHENWKTKVHQLRGFFETKEAATHEHARLCSDHGWLAEPDEISELEDKDWKEAYKLHFKPWKDRGLHWVPIWEKETYELPAGEQIVYLDPGMAFGTGNHETTRLCVRRLLDVRELKNSDVENVSVIDAGCGSGILAISAKKMGFGQCYGFDNDPDSVRISIDNEKLCELEGSIAFEWTDLNGGLKGRKADLVMANILANVLMDHAEIIVSSVSSAGFLCLSGILAREVNEVHSVFAGIIEKTTGKQLSMDSRVDGDWADLFYAFPNIS